jgi:hypothetical protein
VTFNLQNSYSAADDIISEWHKNTFSSKPNSSFDFLSVYGFDV